MSQFDNIKNQCYEANMMLPKLNLVLFTFGNVSAADQQNGVFAIKPSGVPYENLSPNDMVICDFDGKVVEGDLHPSSDTKTHAILYKTWKEIEGIAHTHSTYGTAWAQSLLDIPILGTTHADYLTVDIPCVPAMQDGYIKGDYELNTGLQIIDYFKKKDLDYKEVEMVLVGSHAPFTWGTNANKAVQNSAVLEQCAKMAYLALQINPKANRMNDSLIQKHFERKHGKKAYYGQSKH